MSERSGRGSIAMGGLTPLLDTLFLLLFSLLALSDMRSAREEEVRIELPSVEPGPGDASAEGPVIAIEIGAGGDVRVDGADATLGGPDELDRALAGRLGDALPEEVSVEILADRAAPHGVAVEVLQHLRLRGFVRVDLLATGYGDGDDGDGWGAR